MTEAQYNDIVRIHKQIEDTNKLIEELEYQLDSMDDNRYFAISLHNGDKGLLEKIKGVAKQHLKFKKDIFTNTF